MKQLEAPIAALELNLIKIDESRLQTFHRHHRKISGDDVDDSPDRCCRLSVVSLGQKPLHRESLASGGCCRGCNPLPQTAGVLGS